MDIDVLLSIWQVKVLRTPIIRFAGRHQRIVDRIWAKQARSDEDDES